MNDDYFVDDPSRQPNDWEAYFWREPLVELRDTFIGACSRFSVNPSLVLALMDMRSGIITHPSVTALTKPFGQISYQTGFLDQMDDVLVQLASDYYNILEQQRLEFSTKHSLEVHKTAATQALERLFAAVGEWPEEQLDKLFETHEALFGRPMATPEYEAFYSAMVTNKNARPRMQMPWQLGVTGWSSGGTHANNGASGAFSALDFARRPWPSWGGRMDPIHAAHDGVAERVTSCGLRVTHSSGWGTFYYHLAQVAVREGQTIRRNDRLGVYANTLSQATCNGGSSTGPHVHFALLSRGTFVSLQDARLSNYQVNTGRDHYDSNCERFFYRNHNDGGARVCAWRDLTAFTPR